MDREKQIEEIDELTTVLYEANHKKSVLDYRWLATEAYNAGYRKARKNHTGTDKVLRSIDYRPVEEVRRETAKEIFQRVINICRKEEDFQDGTINTQLEPLYFGIANGCAFIRDEVKELAKQYGVEVEEWYAK